MTEDEKREFEELREEVKKSRDNYNSSCVGAVVVALIIVAVMMLKTCIF